MSELRLNNLSLRQIEGVKKEKGRHSQKAKKHLKQKCDVIDIDIDDQKEHQAAKIK